jgi:hypothetical protein
MFGDSWLELILHLEARICNFCLLKWFSFNTLLLVSLILCSQQWNIHIYFQRIPFGISKWFLVSQTFSYSSILIFYALIVIINLLAGFHISCLPFSYQLLRLWLQLPASGFRYVFVSSYPTNLDPLNTNIAVG